MLVSKYFAVIVIGKPSLAARPQSTTRRLYAGDAIQAKRHY